MDGKFDRIIIGAGLYGLYAALFCCKRNERVLILECDDAPFSRATYINQARVHQGYHYPRSISTASKSAGYFERFKEDFDFCIKRDFDQIYATSDKYSWTNAEQFKEFCKSAGIPCEELNPSAYFKKGMCDGVFRTREYTYDAIILKDYFIEKLKGFSSCVTEYGVRIESIGKDSDEYEIALEDGRAFVARYVLNATYAGTNQILRMAGFDEFKIKYELCEIILCDVNEKLHNTGITVMDGPFFSIMPFGMTGMHSLTSVTFTPHSTSYDRVPTFSCQEKCGDYCDPLHLGNCNFCPAKPKSAFPYMSSLAQKYIREDYTFEYNGSLYSMKPILMSSEIDDSRPTVVKVFSRNPAFVGVLSGKINTVYDLDEVLDDV